ncbi:hypothetical protein R3P38DRAFT_2843157 [Favolaschia claudopus]|uniref:RRM domain-containing protein n=1 Tax=Favolaschia claudopus TaxID=2862362 RepID=A0AAW0E113_9AGAR
MNGCLNLLSRSIRCCSRRTSPLILLCRPHFQSSIPNFESPFRLSDNLFASSSRTGYVYEPPFVRRGVCITNLPLGTTMRQVLNLITVGPLESVEMSEDGTRLNVFFLNGLHAARFVAASTRLAIAGRQLHCAWLPNRQLDPVVAHAVSTDRARRTLLLFKHRDRKDPWMVGFLKTYLPEAEEITVREIKDPLYWEVAVVHFRDISTAMRALEEVPAMLSVHAIYGRDRCEPAPTNETSISPSYPNRFLYQPTSSPLTTADHILTTTDHAFTTVTLSNLHKDTTVRDICKRVFGGKLYAVNLHSDRTADVTFFDAEEAHNFYVAATTNGFTLLGNKVRLEPQTDEPPSRQIDGVPYTRVLRLPLHQTWMRGMFTLSRIAQEFSRCGPLDRVYVAPTFGRKVATPQAVCIAFARAADARFAKTQTNLVHEAYAGRILTYVRDPCARLDPMYDEVELDRPLPVESTRTGQGDRGEADGLRDVWSSDTVQRRTLAASIQTRMMRRNA